jgi:hypothetical protein
LQILEWAKGFEPPTPDLGKAGRPGLQAIQL